MTKPRTGWPCGLAFAFTIACGGDDAPADVEGSTSGPATTSTTTTPSSESDSDACVAGYEGCPCTADGACLDGLICASDLCVDLGDDGSTTGVPLGTTTDDPSTETTGGTSSDPRTTTGESSTSTTAAEDSSSSTTEVEPVCLEGDNYCDMDAATFQTCVDGQWEVSTCVEHCALTGYDSPGCQNTDACLCDGFIDQPCADGALGLCYCAELDFGLTCDTAQWTEFYDSCIAGVDYAVCFIDYPWTGDPADIDCAVAEAACGI